MNPSAGGTDLPDFESGPFNHLGTSPDIVDSLAETREKQTSAAGLSPSAEGKPYAARHSKLLCKVILLSNLRRQKQPKLQKTAEMLKACQVIYAIHSTPHCQGSPRCGGFQRFVLVPGQFFIVIGNGEKVKGFSWGVDTAQPLGVK